MQQQSDKDQELEELGKAMKRVIEKIASKFGNSSNLIIYMDGSGHITTGIFTEEGDFKTVSFDTIRELETILGREL